MMITYEYLVIKITKTNVHLLTIIMIKTMIITVFMATMIMIVKKTKVKKKCVK